MSPTSYYDEFLAALLRADRPAASILLRGAIDAGCDPGELLLGVIQPSMEEVGARWSRQQASLTQYYVAGRIADDVTDVIAPLLKRDGLAAEQGRVVIGTIAGDYHGLGRKIVAAFLSAAGYFVRDLGLGVTPAAFVTAAVEERADVLAISALMMSSIPQIREVKPLLAAQGAGHVRILVGGAPFNYDEGLYRQVGADAMARTAGEVVGEVRKLLSGNTAP